MGWISTEQTVTKVNGSRRLNGPKPINEHGNITGIMLKYRYIS